MELNTNKKARVISAMRIAKQHLFKHMGYIGAYLLIGGVDATGAHLYEVSANGTTMAKAFAADGSGSYCAISILERDFKKDMTVSCYIYLAFSLTSFYPFVLDRRGQGSCPTSSRSRYARRQHVR